MIVWTEFVLVASTDTCACNATNVPVKAEALVVPQMCKCRQNCMWCYKFAIKDTCACVVAHWLVMPQSCKYKQRCLLYYKYASSSGGACRGTRAGAGAGIGACEVIRAGARSGAGVEV